MSNTSKGRIHEKEVERILTDQLGMAVERATPRLVFVKGRVFSTRHDLWRCIDLIALDPELGTLLSQVTQKKANATTRRRKIETNLLGKVGHGHVVLVWCWGTWSLDGRTGTRTGKSRPSFRVHFWDRATTGPGAWSWVADISKKGLVLRHPGGNDSPHLRFLLQSVIEADAAGRGSTNPTGREGLEAPIHAGGRCVPPGAALSDAPMGREEAARAASEVRGAARTDSEHRRPVSAPSRFEAVSPRPIPPGAL
jgi:hypothetical protein